MNDLVIELYALASRYPVVSNSRWFEDVAGAQERGHARDLWATVQELLAELEQDLRSDDPDRGHC